LGIVKEAMEEGRMEIEEGNEGRGGKCCLLLAALGFSW